MRQRQKRIEPLTPTEVDSLIQAASRRAPSGVRNRALISVLYFAGLRVSEALALLPRDLDLEGGAVTVHSGKGGKRRVVGINLAAQAHIDRWLDVRRDLGISSRRRLFSTLKGTPLSDRYCRQFLARLAAKAGIEKRCHPHGLRHSHAAYLAAQRVPMNVVQRQLGHSSLATTGIYLDSINPAAVVEAVRDLEWPAA